MTERPAEEKRFDHSPNITTNGRGGMDKHEIELKTEPAVAVAVKPSTREWVGPVVDYPALLRIGHDLLVALGYDPTDEAIADTPRRWASMWQEFIEFDAGKLDTTFNTTSTDQIVVVRSMKVFSMCEHHLLPFWSEVSIGYLPDGKVLGLSKFARIAQKYAHRLQLQERLTAQIADDVMELTGSGSVAVYATGEHLCMTMRGARTEAQMISVVGRGAFESTALRGQFLDLVRGK